MKNLLRADPDSTVTHGTVYHHRRQIRLQGGFMQEFINPTLIMSIQHSTSLDSVGALQIMPATLKTIYHKRFLSIHCQRKPPSLKINTGNQKNTPPPTPYQKGKEIQWKMEREGEWVRKNKNGARKGKRITFKINNLPYLRVIYRK